MSVVPAVLYIPDVVGSDVLRVLFSSHQIHPLSSLSSSVIVLRVLATRVAFQGEVIQYRKAEGTPRVFIQHSVGEEGLTPSTHLVK